MIFAVDSIPAILAVTTDTFVVFTSNVFALLGLRALYFLLAGAVGRLRYLRPGLSVILAAAAVKLLLSDVFTIPVWVSPAFILSVLAVAAVLSLWDARARSAAGPGTHRAAAPSTAQAPGPAPPRRLRPAPRIRPRRTPGRRRPLTASARYAGYAARAVSVTRLATVWILSTAGSDRELAREQPWPVSPIQPSICDPGRTYRR